MHRLQAHHGAIVLDACHSIFVEDATLIGQIAKYFDERHFTTIVPYEKMLVGRPLGLTYVAFKCLTCVQRVQVGDVHHVRFLIGIFAAGGTQ